MSATVIELQEVTKRFDAVTAVDRISLAFQENEFFVLLGPSGCGKTTLLRLIAGFEQPDQGRVLLDGRDITALRPNRRPVNLMFQSYALFPHMTVWHNVAYGLEMEGIKGAPLKERVGAALETARLSELADRKPDQLSGGQRQRVALVRALVKRPRVLLLDEPLGALDRKLREEMQLELKRLQHEVGITFVVVTHDQGEALVMADRIALLNQGRIAQLASARDLYDKPANRFVADFIGEMNLFEGRADQGALVLPNGLRLIAPEPADHDSLALVVRPERIRLARQPWPVAELDNQIEGEVAEIAYHGQDLSVQVRAAGIDKPLLLRLASASEAAVSLSRGDKVWCGWAAKDGRLLVS